MLNLPRLRMLRELHRCGTLAQVAQELSYTPSAVSQQLSLLERETGVQLLEPVGRGVRLTDDALALVAHTEIVLAQLEQAEAELAAAQPDIRGKLRVASFQTAVLTIAPTALTLLAERHPALQVEITQREVARAYSGLLSHEYDVILGEEYPGLPEPIRDGIDRFNLLSDPLRLALPLEGPLAKRPETLADLAHAPWALEPVETPTGAWARAMCRAAGFEPQLRFESPDPLLHAHLVRTGHAVAFIPVLIAAQHLEGTQLIGLPGNPQRMLYTAVRSGRTNHPAIRALRTALAEAAVQDSSPAPIWSLDPTTAD